MKEIIIFCQAPADIQYTLDIYDRNINNAKISIFCINVKGMYKFISSLNLNLKKLIFIPYFNDFSIKKPIDVFTERNRLKRLFNEYFFEMTGNKLYFFSNRYDWVLYSILIKLHKNNKIYLIDHYKYTSVKNIEENFSIKSVIVKLIYQFITGVYMNSLLFNNKLILNFPINRFNIKKLATPQNIQKIRNKYQYNGLIKKKSVLIFESGISDSELIQNYEQTICKIIQIFIENDYNVYIKPHPRLGFTKQLQNFGKLIPPHIPGEFLPISEFISVFGISSAVIGKLAMDNKNIYSIIDCFNFINISNKITYKKYLNDQSNNKIIFVSNLKSLSDLITSF